MLKNDFQVSTKALASMTNSPHHLKLGEGGGDGDGYGDGDGISGDVLNNAASASVWESVRQHHHFHVSPHQTNP